ncbi:MAG: hypothetical protein ACK5P7_05570 [Bdellovibrio sp.]
MNQILKQLKNVKMLFSRLLNGPASVGEALRSSGLHDHSVRAPRSCWM